MERGRRPTAERRALVSRIAADLTALEPFLDLIVGLTEADPANRWTLDRAEEFLASAHRTIRRQPARGSLPAGAVDRTPATPGGAHPARWQP
jgi:hypothetical protein